MAWKAVCPSVILLKKFYEFALELETALCDLLTVLCSPDMPAIQHLEKQQVWREGGGREGGRREEEEKEGGRRDIETVGGKRTKPGEKAAKFTHMYTTPL